MGIPSQSNRLSNFSKNLFTGRELNARTLDKLEPVNVLKARIRSPASFAGDLSFAKEADRVPL